MQILIVDVVVIIPRIRGELILVVVKAVRVHGVYLCRRSDKIERGVDDGAVCVGGAVAVVEEEEGGQ